MLKIFIIVLIYFISLVNFAQTSSEKQINGENELSYQVKVQVNDIVSNKGKVYFALYNSEESFNQRKYFQGEMSKIENGRASVTFKNLPVNKYAIVCFHDINSNGKMDFEANGMPIEDYGASNNVMNFGPPQFDDAKFELTNKDLIFEIKF